MLVRHGRFLKPVKYLIGCLASKIFVYFSILGIIFFYLPKVCYLINWHVGRVSTVCRRKDGEALGSTRPGGFGCTGFFQETNECH